MEPDDYPVSFAAADRTSMQGQGRYLRLVRADLVLVVVAAGLGAVGAVVPDGQRPVFAALTAIALIGGLVLKTTLRQRNDDQEWFGGRAVAESVKSSSWRYMLRLEPYEDDQSADARFVQSLAAIQSARVTLGHALPETPQAWEEITPRMRQVRALPLVERRAVYLSERLEDQARWYRAKALANRQAAER